MVCLGYKYNDRLCDNIHIWHVSDVQKLENNANFRELMERGSWCIVYIWWQIVNNGILSAVKLVWYLSALKFVILGKGKKGTCLIVKRDIVCAWIRDRTIVNVDTLFFSESA